VVTQALDHDTGERQSSGSAAALGDETADALDRVLVGADGRLPALDGHRRRRCPYPLETVAEGEDGGALDLGETLRPCNLPAGDFCRGISERLEDGLKVGLQAAGDQAVVGVDHQVAPRGLRGAVADPFDFLEALLQRGVMPPGVPASRQQPGTPAGRSNSAADHFSSAATAPDQSMKAIGVTAASASSSRTISTNQSTKCCPNHQVRVCR
jgi:hypothetical protein